MRIIHNIRSIWQYREPLRPTFELGERHKKVKAPRETRLGACLESERDARCDVTTSEEAIRNGTGFSDKRFIVIVETG